MTENKYPLYGALILAGAGVAIWAGLSPFFLLFLLVCPLMMFFMMRGMGGGMAGHSSTTKAEDPDRALRAARKDSDTDSAPDHTSV